MEPFEVEAQHLRELLQVASRECAAAGFEGELNSQIAQALERARCFEAAERELGRARERLRQLEGCLVDAVMCLRRDGVGRSEVFQRASDLIPLQEAGR